MNQTNKKISSTDYENALRYSFNDSDKSISTSSFVTAKIGHKIVRTDIDLVTEQFSYFDNSTLLYTIQIIYTDATQDKIASVERIA